jgi:hypothetical protein
MPTARSLIAGLALAMTAVACSDKGPTEANNATSGEKTAPPVAATRPVTQKLVFTSDPVQTWSNTLGTVTAASVQITKFYYENNQLFVDGALLNASGAVSQTFSHAAATLTSSGAPTAAVCDILTLDIGEIHLDLLGLDVDLAPVHLDITAVSGSGNLLGNLLCALTHLLDQSALGTLITNLINQINAILAGL